MTTANPHLTARPSASRYDWGLITIVTALLLFGIVMVFSASYPWAIRFQTTPFFYIARHLQWIAVGVVAMLAMASVPYTVWERWSVPLLAVGLVALVAVIVLGDDRFGAKRTLFEGSVQPSEPVKIIVLIYISTWLASKGSRIRDINYGLIPFGILMGIVAGLIVAQPNISTTILIVTTATIIFFLAGAETKQILFGGSIAIATFWLIVTRNDYAQKRVEALLQSIRNPLGSTEHQIFQASQALVTGGPLGAGLGNSLEKFPGNLPLSWSDNIFAIVGEELGLIGTLLVILLFVLFTYRGLRIASRTPDMFGSLLAVGITCLVALQAILHIAVVVAVAPPTGVTLPFISFGGSSMVTMLGATGILLSISRFQGWQPARGPSRKTTNNATFDLRWGNRRPRLPSAGGSAPARKSVANKGKRPASRTASATRR
ncbi:MAG: cell division protein FtsW [Chloroflexi bacterium]|nr:MAG: cell division protein FtsW [Chloroflexota bacterium]